jgi:hypothetical protein
MFDLWLEPSGAPELMPAAARSTHDPSDFIDVGVVHPATGQ